MDYTQSAITDMSDSDVKRPVSYYPLTTQGKIELMRWRRIQNKVEPRDKPQNASQTAENGAAQSLASPSDIAELSRLLRLRKAEKPTKPGWNVNKNKPITTQQKLEAAHAMAATRADRHAKGWKPSRKVQIPGIVTQVAKHNDFQLLPAIGRVANRRVLSRKTHRAEAWARKHTATNNHWIHTGEPLTVCWLTNLPEHVRSRIWHLAVVDHSFFVWPESPDGQEQPDLAMTCRQIRREVLPIFYGCSTFGVALSPIREMHVRSAQNPIRGIAAVWKWAAALEAEHEAPGGRSWLALARNWVFEYSRSSSAGRGARGSDDEDDENDDSFIVVVKFSGEEEDAGASQSKLSVHRGATCVLPGWSACGKCSAGPPLDRLVLDVSIAQEQVLRDGGATGKIITGLGQRLAASAEQISRARCRP